MNTTAQISVVVLLGVIGVGLPVYREFVDPIVTTTTTIPALPRAPTVQRQDSPESKVSGSSSKSGRWYSESVKNSFLNAYPSVKIGDALEVALRDGVWTDATTASGARIASFEGGLSPDTAADLRSEVEQVPELVAIEASGMPFWTRDIGAGQLVRYEFVLNQDGKTLTKRGPIINNKLLPAEFGKFYDSSIFK